MRIWLGSKNFSCQIKFSLGGKLANAMLHTSAEQESWQRIHLFNNGWSKNINWQLHYLGVKMFLFFIFLLDPPSIRCYIKCMGKRWAYSNGCNKRWWRGAGGSAGQGSRLHRQPHAPEVCKAVLRYNKKLYENYIDIYIYYGMVIIMMCER